MDEGSTHIVCMPSALYKFICISCEPKTNNHAAFECTGFKSLKI